MRVRTTGFVGLACLALMGCDGLGTTSATLTPLPTTKPIAVPSTTTTIVPPAVATAAATTATPAPTTITMPADTTTATAEAETTTSLASLAPVTTVAATTTTARSASTTSTTSSTIPARALAKTWIMQLGSAPAGATKEAIAGQLAKLRAIDPRTSTLNSGDWRKSFDGPDRVIFFVPGFDSRGAVHIECARLKLSYPDQCLARYLKN